jgi:preprotein translocase subunit Sec61beta
MENKNERVGLQRFSEAEEQSASKLDHKGAVVL